MANVPTKLTLSNLIHIEQGEQGMYDFFLSKLNAREIANFSETIRLAESHDGIQRFLDMKRVKAIADYCESKNSIFPTPIILSLNSDFLIETSNHRLSINIEENFIKELGVPFSIIDGQHRIEGINYYYERLQGKKEFNLPVIIYLDADQAKAAKIFVTINANQRSVDQSIIHELFGIIYKDQSIYTVQSFSNRVVKILNEVTRSPFYHSIKMLGRKLNAEEFISQGTISKKISERISSNIGKDNLAIERGLPLINSEDKIFREYFWNNDSDIVAKLILNFFIPFSEIFEEVWNRKGYITNKAIGFSALMKLLDYIYNNTEYLQEEDFRSYFEKMNNKYGNEIIKLFEVKGSSESVANSIAEDLKEFYEKANSEQSQTKEI